MQLKRRMFLQGSAALAMLVALPRAILAAAWPASAFASEEQGDAMSELLGITQTTPTDKIELGLPVIAENGAVVPVDISTTLENVKSISIFVAKNPRPLAASFELPPGTMPVISCRIKMGQTSDVTAVVRTADGDYSASREVKVTIGGCGG